MHNPNTITALMRETQTVVRLTGEIDAGLRDPAGAALSTALGASRPVVVDMHDVTFMDSTGVAFLIQCHRACREADLPFQLEHVPEPARRVLGTLGLDRILPGAEPPSAP